MQAPPRIGTTAEQTFIVEPAQTIHFSSVGAPPVLSTPALVWFLEHAALDAAAPFLDPGELTVGTHVAVDHLAATPLGARVVCRARVVHVEGPVISYQLEASDDREVIARGFHKRRVVSAEKFAARVARKTPT